MKERVSSKRRVSVPVYTNAQGRQPIDGELYKQTGSFVTAYLVILLPVPYFLRKPQTAA